MICLYILYGIYHQQMKKQSAGILLYRLKNHLLEVLLVHPGGPFWKNKDAGAWSIPKGEFTEEEDALAAAKRECLEELGLALDGQFAPLTPLKQKSGKIVYAWALQGDVDPAVIQSNTFEIEWPKHSGKLQTFPEVDKAGWFTKEAAKEKINPSQAAFINELAQILENGCDIKKNKSGCAGF